MNSITDAIFTLAPQLQEGAKQSSEYTMIQCPFHGGGREKTPSCSVKHDAPVFNCFACGTSGHISRLLKTLGLGDEGVATILRITGLDKPGEKSKKGKVATRLTAGTNVYRGQFILNEDLLDAYRQAPKSLLQAGFEKSTLRHFEVGFDSTNLRITYPIRNIYGELVGVSGRAILESQEPRYKIYDYELKSREGFYVPENYTMEGMKDAVLWHAHIVRPFLYDALADVLVITEGFKAAMWTWQSGYQSVVALIGSYLTGLHAELIAGFCQNVILFLDNNEAGIRGTERAGRVLSKYGIRVRVANYPDDREQADDLSPDKVKLAIDEPRTYLNWRSDHDRIVCENARYGRRIRSTEDR